MWWVGAIRIFRVCFHDLPDSTLLYFFIFSLLLLLSLTIDGLSLSHFVKPSFCSLFPLKARVCGAWSILAYDHMHFCISEPFRSCCLSLSLWNLRRTDFLRDMALSVHLSSLLFSSLLCSLLIFEPFVLSCWDMIFFFLDRFWLVSWRLSVRLIVFQIELLANLNLNTWPAQCFHWTLD